MRFKSDLISLKLTLYYNQISYQFLTHNFSTDPPRVSVELIEVQNPVKEGTDVSLRCKTSASPPAESYNWYHNVSIIFVLLVLFFFLLF